MRKRLLIAAPGSPTMPTRARRPSEPGAIRALEIQMGLVPVHQEAADAIEDSVAIDRPVHEVFAFYGDFRNLPRFLGDVMEVEQVDSRTTRWTIQGPLGVHVHWTAVTTEIVDDRRIFYETTSDLLKTRWQIHFSPGANAGQTIVREVMITPGGKAAQVALSLIGKNPSAEVHHNLNRLKQYLETGRVTDGQDAVPGKFPPA